ncbi:Thioredoxin 1 [Buchnera aphidicola (Tetraneura ulmi)]|uniref:thioredoxin n=1 Tax=Buchnera aphidicola TaxID=9 RepID=UPI003463B071
MKKSRLIDLSENEFDKYLDSNKNQLLIIDFWAKWCAPCKQLSPILESVANEYTDNENLIFIKIDIDENKKNALKYQIKSIPTLLFIRNKSILNRVSGLISKFKIKELISNYLV